MERTHISVEINVTAPKNGVSHEPAEFSWTAFSLRLLELKMVKKKSGGTEENICKSAGYGRGGNGR